MGQWMVLRKETPPYLHMKPTKVMLPLSNDLDGIQELVNREMSHRTLFCDMICERVWPTKGDEFDEVLLLKTSST